MEKTSKTRGIITFIIAIIAVIVMIATSGLLGVNFKYCVNLHYGVE